MLLYHFAVGLVEKDSDCWRVRGYGFCVDRSEGWAAANQLGAVNVACGAPRPSRPFLRICAVMAVLVADGGRIGEE